MMLVCWASRPMRRRKHRQPMTQAPGRAAQHTLSHELAFVRARLTPRASGLREKGPAR